MKNTYAIILVFVVIVVGMGLVAWGLLHFLSGSSGQPGGNGGLYTGGNSSDGNISPGNISGNNNSNQQTSTGGGTYTNTASTSGSGTNPGGSASSNKIFHVPTDSGTSVGVNDFRSSASTVTTTNIPGHYFLAGGLDPSGSHAPYSMFYVDTDGSFIVDLLVKPLAQTRQAAEQQLMQVLGVSKGEMCSLRYWVGVSADVDSSLAGKNLGFSFCPGAAQL